MYRLYVKRSLDVLFSVLMFIVASPLMVIITILIKATSDGPALFTQKRHGVDGSTFTLYKFRSMRQGAPIVSAQDAGKTLDSQITAIGSFLRGSSLDELPQLFNILKGDMSFIGPRPLADVDKETLILRAENGSDTVKPGITGLAQVNGRNFLNAEEKAHYDKLYADSISFGTDFKIVWQTFYHVIVRTGITHE